jgi:protein ImuB
MGRIDRALAGLRVPARLAVAPTVGGAWGMTYAQQAKGVRIIISDDLLGALVPLPPVALRLEEEVLETLHHLGLRTVGEVMALPRELLPARFGPTLLMRIDQALGRVAEPLVPLRYQAPIEASVDFDGVVDSLEALWLTFKNLITEVTGHLVRRGLGARRLAVTFLRPYAPAVERTIELSRPSRNPAILFNLIRCTMETIGDAVPKRGGKRPALFRLHAQSGARRRRRTLDQSDFISRGFIGLRLAVPVFERLSEEQIFLLEQEEQRGQEELDRLIERLRIRLGQEALVAVEAVESHVPERAYRVGSGVRVQGSAKKGKGAASSFSEPYALSPEPSARPLHLLPMPREVRVMVRPSHDRDGAPVAFTMDGETRPIVQAVGPERIGGAWWTGNNKTRDYFDVEDEAGRRWWLFRVLQSSKWYLHGSFE